MQKLEGCGVEVMVSNSMWRHQWRHLIIFQDKNLRVVLTMPQCQRVPDPCLHHLQEDLSSSVLFCLITSGSQLLWASLHPTASLRGWSWRGDFGMERHLLMSLSFISGWEISSGTIPTDFSSCHFIHTHVTWSTAARRKTRMEGIRHFPSIFCGVSAAWKKEEIRVIDFVSDNIYRMKHTPVFLLQQIDALSAQGLYPKHKRKNPLIILKYYPLYITTHTQMGMC